MKLRNLAFLLLTAPLVAFAADPEFALTIKDHRFSPAELRIPAGKKIKLIIDNQDGTAEEFESKSLHLEKIIAAKSKATVNVGPLKAGQYPFVGEYNEAIARGTLIAE